MRPRSGDGSVAHARGNIILGLEAFHREAQTRFAAYLARHRDELRTLDVELAAFVCITSIEAVTHGSVRYRPDLMKDAAIYTPVDEATRLIVAYLQPGSGQEKPVRKNGARKG